MVFTAKVENLEIRGKEVKQGKNGEYAIVKFDNEAGDRIEFVDRNAERFAYYERGKLCDITLKVTDTAKYTNFTICDMKYREEQLLGGGKMENMTIIKVLDEQGNYYNNAFVENDHDALQIAMFYRNVLGYTVQIWKNDKDITAMLDSVKLVPVKQFDIQKKYAII